MEAEYSIIITTYPNKEAAKQVAKLLIEKCLAACVQMLPIESVYLWQGNVCDEDEVMLLIKSRTVLYDKIVKVIKEHHTYEVPEMIQISITDGLPEYLKWMSDCTSFPI